MLPLGRLSLEAKLPTTPRQMLNSARRMWLQEVPLPSQRSEREDWQKEHPGYQRGGGRVEVDGNRGGGAA